ncbi:hypothetical protein ACJMK2_016183 [Sinanodonta woodiana]|uniref:Chitin-binding type-2 domain-containing protein n=1 Tax=Sinanodonta woodiana TaxID=1069815 RepID=A0ABD3UWG9_SINWO
MANQFYFDDTCVPVYKANCSETYINPCDCRKYYQCERNQYLLIPRDCGQSSAYDQDLKICNHENKIIYSGKCNLTAPWGRCNASGNHNPTYNTGSTLRPSLPARPEYQTANGTLQTNTQGNDFVYDNHAFRDETGISQSLEAVAGITGQTRPYMTLEHVNNIAQGYDQISAVGSPRYTSEITTLGQAFADSFNKAGEEGVTQTISEGVSSLETDRENDVTAERTTGNEQG